MEAKGERYGAGWPGHHWLGRVRAEGLSAADAPRLSEQARLNAHDIGDVNRRLAQAGLSPENRDRLQNRLYALEEPGARLRALLHLVDAGRDRDRKTLEEELDDLFHLMREGEMDSERKAADASSRRSFGARLDWRYVPGYFGPQGRKIALLEMARQLAIPMSPAKTLLNAAGEATEPKAATKERNGTTKTKTETKTDTKAPNGATNEAKTPTKAVGCEDATVGERFSHVDLDASWSMSMTAVSLPSSDMNRPPRAAAKQAAGPEAKEAKETKGTKATKETKTRVGDGADENLFHPSIDHYDPVRTRITPFGFLQEKVDGSQLSFRYDAKADAVRFSCGSRALDVDKQRTDSPFLKTMLGLVANRRLLNPSWQYHGECVQRLRHSTTQYKRLPRHGVIIYQIQRVDTRASDDDGDLAAEEAQGRLGFDRVPVYWDESWRTRPHAVLSMDATAHHSRIVPVDAQGWSEEGQARSYEGWCAESRRKWQAVHDQQAVWKGADDVADVLVSAAAFPREIARLAGEFATEGIESVLGGKCEGSVWRDNECSKKFKRMQPAFAEMRKMKAAGKAVSLSPSQYLRWVGAHFDVEPRFAKARQHLSQRGASVVPTIEEMRAELDADLRKERLEFIAGLLYPEFANALRKMRLGTLGRADLERDPEAFRRLARVNEALLALHPGLADERRQIADPAETTGLCTQPATCDAKTSASSAEAQNAQMMGALMQLQSSIHRMRDNNASQFTSVMSTFEEHSGSLATLHATTSVLATQEAVRAPVKVRTDGLLLKGRMVPGEAKAAKKRKEKPSDEEILLLRRAKQSKAKAKAEADPEAERLRRAKDGRRDSILDVVRREQALRADITQLVLAAFLDDVLAHARASLPVWFRTHVLDCAEY